MTTLAQSEVLHGSAIFLLNTTDAQEIREIENMRIEIKGYNGRVISVPINMEEQIASLATAVQLGGYYIEDCSFVHSFTYYNDAPPKSTVRWDDECSQLVGVPEL